MTDQTDKIKSPAVSTNARQILAPHIWPHPPTPQVNGGEALAYLSWAGWELYLARRLGLKPEDGFYPLLLPDLTTPEQDFAAIDQLATTVGELGAGVLALSRRTPESVPGLAAAIGHYREAADVPASPVLDDRSYLALWAINEYRTYQSNRFLAEAKVKEKAMWAALKGEDASFSAAPLSAPVDEPEPDSRTIYAWGCWQRLAGPLLNSTDIIIPSAPGKNSNASNL